MKKIFIYNIFYSILIFLLVYNFYTILNYIEDTDYNNTFLLSTLITFSFIIFQLVNYYGKKFKWKIKII